MTKWVAPQTLDPTKVKVVITTKWSGTAYKSVTIRRVESYSVSSQLDSDADPWQIEIGNPDKDLNPTLARDNEVRVQVYGAGPTGNVPLLSGITDDVSYSEQGTLILSGRDMSCIAVDSDHFPFIYRGMSPTKIIQMEAQAIKCANKFQITKIVGGPLQQFTDGSEKYWEFWYRMVRKDGMWIWMLADGTLVISKLNYNDPPVYRFISGTAKNSGNDGIMVESVNWHKSTQTRIGKLGIEWRTQNTTATGKPSLSMFEDVTNRDWLKRPNKIIQDKHVTSQQSAYKSAVEELFETRVGAIEISLTVQDPGFMIRQNRMATVDIPEMGLKGDWFVVGSTVHGDTNGFLQEVRLREKKFAISKRVPDDPVWQKDTTDTSGNAGEPSGKAAAAIFKQMNGHNDWWDCYVAAAQKWHGAYDWMLFMATLLAITDHETGFTNERSLQTGDGKGNHGTPPGKGHRVWEDIRPATPQELATFHEDFSNEGGDGYLPRGWNCAVGPMQLFDTNIKQEADTMGGGAVDEFFGNRWNPCDNIMAAAHLLITKARTVSTTGASQADLWAGVCRYGGFSNPDCPYGKDIAHRVLVDPNWLQLVQDAWNSVEPATGGTGSPPGTYTSPFNKSDYNLLGLNRIDMGIDYSAPFGTPILAMGEGVICVVNHSREGQSVNEWPPFVSYILSDPTGDHYQEIVYVAENIRIGNFKSGDKVSTGDQIAIFTGGIETGFAANTTGDSTCVEDPEPHANNRMGKAFSRWLVELGCPISNKPADPGPGTTHSECKGKVP